MSAPDLDRDEYCWPAHWPRHSHPHDYLDCRRCTREADHVETHLDCRCVDHDWYRVDLGSPATPRLVWTCRACLRIQGPAYSGGAA